MTVTLAGAELKVVGLRERVEAAATLWDSWGPGGYTRKAQAYGSVRGWTLDCVEQGVVWSSSAARLLEEKIKAGEAVPFTVNEPGHTVSTSVYVLGVEVGYGGGLALHRRFRVELLEAV
jgi:hypothetical protein